MLFCDTLIFCVPLIPLAMPATNRRFAVRHMVFVASVLCNSIAYERLADTFTDLHCQSSGYVCACLRNELGTGRVA